MFYVLCNVQSYTENSHNISHISQLTCENCNIGLQLWMHKSSWSTQNLWETLTKNIAYPWISYNSICIWSGRISVKYTKKRIAPHFTSMRTWYISYNCMTEYRPTALSRHEKCSASAMNLSSFGSEAWKLVLKLKYVDFSRDSETVSHCHRKVRVQRLTTILILE